MIIIPLCLQDFHLLVENPRKQKLYIEVKDSLGFTDLTIGTGEVISSTWLHPFKKSA